jgi:hypothetical protein
LLSATPTRYRPSLPDPVRNSAWSWNGGGEHPLVL